MQPFNEFKEVEEKTIEERVEALEYKVEVLRKAVNARYYGIAYMKIDSDWTLR